MKVNDGIVTGGGGGVNETNRGSSPSSQGFLSSLSPWSACSPSSGPPIGVNSLSTSSVMGFTRGVLGIFAPGGSILKTAVQTVGLLTLFSQFGPARSAISTLSTAVSSATPPTTAENSTSTTAVSSAAPPTTAENSTSAVSIPVSNWEQFTEIGNSPDRPLSASYYQTANIVASSGASVGSTTTPFTGHYDGQGNGVTNVTQCLFGGMSAQAGVKDLRMSDSLVKSTEEQTSVGMVACRAEEQTSFSGIQMNGVSLSVQGMYVSAGMVSPEGTLENAHFENVTLRVEGPRNLGSIGVVRGNTHNMTVLDAQVNMDSVDNPFSHYHYDFSKCAVGSVEGSVKELFVDGLKASLAGDGQRLVLGSMHSEASEVKVQNTAVSATGLVSMFGVGAWEDSNHVEVNNLDVSMSGDDATCMVGSSSGSASGVLASNVNIEVRGRHSTVWVGSMQRDVEDMSVKGSNFRASGYGPNIALGSMYGNVNANANNLSVTDTTCTILGEHGAIVLGASDGNVARASVENSNLALIGNSNVLCVGSSLGNVTALSTQDVDLSVNGRHNLVILGSQEGTVSHASMRNTKISLNGTCNSIVVNHPGSGANAACSVNGEGVEDCLLPDAAHEGCDGTPATTLEPKEMDVVPAGALGLGIGLAVALAVPVAVVCCFSWLRGYRQGDSGWRLVTRPYRDVREALFSGVGAGEGAVQEIELIERKRDGGGDISVTSPLQNEGEEEDMV